MRIVITGAFGFIGSHFAKWVFNLDDDIKILVVDNCTYAANRDNLKGVTYEWLNKDICNVTAIDLGEYDFNKVNTFTKVKQKQISDFLTHNEPNTPSGSLGFRLHSGEFVLSDVRLRPFSELNFSPGFFKANVPMPKPTKRGKAYDFVVELFDANNNLAEAVAIADDVVFTGAPQVIGDGSDGVLTGSVFLSNTQDAGIELRRGAMTRDQAINLVNLYDGIFPEEHVDKYLNYFGKLNFKLKKLLHLYIVGLTPKFLKDLLKKK